MPPNAEKTYQPKWWGSSHDDNEYSEWTVSSRGWDMNHPLGVLWIACDEPFDAHCGITTYTLGATDPRGVEVTQTTGGFLPARGVTDERTTDVPNPACSSPVP